ncbi:MAG TPA: WecB/TagA/CpsF family glycosyltransferase [Verrucomicrobiae bacterium]|nr:WecB/TagA/CpsF family glycosyltransferase [Verrucomicrobiae bacterium]
MPERARYANPPIAILGVPFDNVTTAETIAAIERMVESGEPHYLVTANVDFLVQAKEDVELRRILFDAHLVLCDGTPLVWASRLLGNPLLERVAGADLVPLLLRVAAEKGYRVFFLGATPESSERAVRNLKKLHPELIIADHYSPPFNKLLEMDHDEIKRRIVAAKPDLLFVSLGCPKQEKWIAMHYRSLGVPVSAGVGATIDFLAGSVKRAPLWMQRSGTEWIYRLAQEPRRLFKRYFKDLWVFGWAMLVQLWQLQPRSRQPESPQVQTPAPRIPMRSGENWQWLKVPERLDLAAVREEVLPLDEILADHRHCLLEMDNVKFIDSTGIGLLIRLQKKIRENGRQLILLAPSPMVRRALALMQLQNFFATAPDFASAQQLIVTRTREQNGAVRLRSPAAINPVLWQGEITAANAAEVWATTETHLASKQRRELIIDMSGVRFMDSTGLGVMVRAKKRAQLEGVKLEFTYPQPAVQNVIHLARLEEFLLAESPRELAVK